LRQIIQIEKISYTKGNRCVVTAFSKQSTWMIVTVLDVVHQYRLETGKILDEKQFNAFIRDSEEALLYNVALTYISHQMRTVFDLRKRLNRESKNTQLIDKVIHKLEEQKYIGDEMYAAEFVSQMKHQLVGKTWIQNKLAQKGIDSNIIIKVLSDYDELEDEDKVLSLLKSELRIVVRKPYFRFLDSFKRKCLSKGFLYQTIEQVIQMQKDFIHNHIDEQSALRKEKLPRNTLHLGYLEKQKLIQKLRQKGYSNQAIVYLLEREDIDE